MSMRILHLSKTSEGGGWAFAQVRDLRRRGIDVHIVLPSRSGFADAYEGIGATVHVLPISLARVASLETRRAFRRLVAETSPDIIHSHFVSTTLFMRLVLGRAHPVPRVFQVPGPLHLETAAIRSAEILTAGPSDNWLGACRRTVQYYRDAGVPAGRVGLCYYGGDWERLEGDPDPAVDLGELDGRSAAVKIGMVAYVYPPKKWLGQRRGIKGHEDLIDALALLRGRGWDVHGVFAGGPWGDAAQYYSEVRDYGTKVLGDRAHFLGTRSDVRDIYASLDVAVHPSHSENLGGAADSLFLGVPTVATSVGGFPDIVRPGLTGRLAAPKNPASLADQIEAVLREPVLAREQARAGGGLVSRNLTIRATGDVLISHYEGLIRDRAVHPWSGF
ncbi:hypothetical protein GCM10009422_02520 [Brevundimonas kwangchunensis]|uniref:Glycosyltransferase subfamily 4-like N-terminal domain-containing protein n=1 Tax=Brevundimonas kwangchunensis TaxID=322163 RepID=A0ABP3RIN5_9CAUL